MIDKISAIDFTENNICSGLSFTDVLEFNDSKTVNRFEDAICNLNFTSDLVKGTVIDPIIKMVSAKYRPQQCMMYVWVCVCVFSRVNRGGTV